MHLRADSSFQVVLPLPLPSRGTHLAKASWRSVLVMILFTKFDGKTSPRRRAILVKGSATHASTNQAKPPCRLFAKSRSLVQFQPCSHTACQQQTQNQQSRAGDSSGRPTTGIGQCLGLSTVTCSFP